MLEDIYYKPGELISVEGGSPVHRLELVNNKQFAGMAELIYRGSPFPHYYLVHLVVLKQYQGNGYGSTLLDLTNQLLLGKRCSGLLRVSLPKDDPVYNMYQRYGWKEVEQYPGWQTFNLPAGINCQTLDTAIEKTYRWLDRGGYLPFLIQSRANRSPVTNAAN